jgi:pimeloyl-ACP methyl ester carboxylesterase
VWQEVLRRFRLESRPWNIERNGHTLSGRVWGQGPPLYLLCGIGGSLELYALFVWLLRERFRCVLWEYPGNIPPERHPQNLTAADLADDLWAIADSHGDESFSLYATSFGTVVALTAMLQSPDRVERAVLQGGFAHRRFSWFERSMTRVCCRVPGTMRQFPGRNVVQRQNHRGWFPPFDVSRWQFTSRAGHFWLTTRGRSRSRPSPTAPPCWTVWI